MSRKRHRSEILWVALIAGLAFHFFPGAEAYAITEGKPAGFDAATIPPEPDDFQKTFDALQERLNDCNDPAKRANVYQDIKNEGNKIADNWNRLADDYDQNKGKPPALLPDYNTAMDAYNAALAKINKLRSLCDQCEFATALVDARQSAVGGDGNKDCTDDIAKYRDGSSRQVFRSKGEKGEIGKKGEINKYIFKKGDFTETWILQQPPPPNSWASDKAGKWTGHPTDLQDMKKGVYSYVDKNGIKYIFDCPGNVLKKVPCRYRTDALKMPKSNGLFRPLQYFLLTGQWADPKKDLQEVRTYLPGWLEEVKKDLGKDEKGQDIKSKMGTNYATRLDFERFKTKDDPPQDYIIVYDNKTGEYIGMIYHDKGKNLINLVFCKDAMPRITAAEKEALKKQKPPPLQQLPKGVLELDKEYSVEANGKKYKVKFTKDGISIDGKNKVFNIFNKQNTKLKQVITKIENDGQQLKIYGYTDSILFRNVGENNNPPQKAQLNNDQMKSLLPGGDIERGTFIEPGSRDIYTFQIK